MELVIKTLKEHSCLSAKQISAFIYHNYGINKTPQSISGNLRSLVSKGKAGYSNCGNGSKVYWLIGEN